ncbi:hypothetical protein N0V94_004910 [Neodidymelliopsis sp. IMI 364377]|nr:hypothetical protein N0V94_004910 [Neodidymelliopsis sp. IMI 364377]
MSDSDFDPSATLQLLGKYDLFQWPGRQSSCLVSIGDALTIMQAMTDLHAEIYDAAGLVGECMFVGVHATLDPYMQTPPFTVSTTEHARIACSLLIIKIYHELRLKFLCCAPEHLTEFAEAFMRNLKPWEIDQATSLTPFLNEDDYDLCDQFLAMVRMRSDVLERLLESDCVKNFSRRSGFAFGSGGPRITFEFAAKRLQHGRPTGRTWLHVFGDVGYHSRPLSITNELQYHAPACSESALQQAPVWDFHVHMNMVQLQGLLFWDYDRLERWNLADTDQPTAAHEFLRKVSDIVRDDVGIPWQKQIYEPENIEHTKQRQLVEWMRCPTQCTLEEWLWQRTVDTDLIRSRELFPRKYIELGAVCRICGQDGHWATRCRLDLWSDDEGETGVDV